MTPFFSSNTKFNSSTFRLHTGLYFTFAWCVIIIFTYNLQDNDREYVISIWLHGSEVKEILAPFLIYVFVTTFTPGPNNITATSMGMNYGYATALKCIFGIVSGFICVAFFCGFLTQTVR
jgi:hypothetical protein